MFYSSKRGRERWGKRVGKKERSEMTSRGKNVIQVHQSEESPKELIRCNTITLGEVVNNHLESTRF